jgi:DNA-binding IscR family transcriptional regulator
VLNRPAGQIPLAELLDVMGEPFHLADCNRPAGETCGAAEVCSLEAVCPVRSAIAEVDRRIREVLRTVSLADVFRGSDRAADSREGGCIQYGLEVALRERGQPDSFRPEPVLAT